MDHGIALSSYLQDRMFLQSLSGADWDTIMDCVIVRGREWFANNGWQRALIVDNAVVFNPAVTADQIDEIVHHTVLHYAEKLAVALIDPALLSKELTTRLDIRAFEKMVARARNQSGLLLAVPHFGAVELIAPRLALSGMPLSVAMRFATPLFAEMVKKRSAELVASGLFGPITFIEIGSADSAAALSMAAALRRGDTVITVFDERTPYSRPVALRGATVWGGAGLDRIAKFCNASLCVASIAAVRTEQGSALLSAAIHLQRDETLVAALFGHLEQLLTSHFEQWYFLHEEIAFVK